MYNQRVNSQPHPVITTVSLVLCQFREREKKKALINLLRKPHEIYLQNIYPRMNNPFKLFIFILIKSILHTNLGEKNGHETYGCDLIHLEANKAVNCTLNINRTKCMQTLFVCLTCTQFPLHTDEGDYPH